VREKVRFWVGILGTIIRLTFLWFLAFSSFLACSWFRPSGGTNSALCNIPILFFFSFSIFAFRFAVSCPFQSLFAAKHCGIAGINAVDFLGQYQAQVAIFGSLLRRHRKFGGEAKVPGFVKNEASRNLKRSI